MIGFDRNKLNPTPPIFASDSHSIIKAHHHQNKEQNRNHNIGVSQRIKRVNKTHKMRKNKIAAHTTQVEPPTDFRKRGKKGTTAEQPDNPSKQTRIRINHRSQTQQKHSPKDKRHQKQRKNNTKERNRHIGQNCPD